MMENINSQNIRDFISKLAKLDIPILLKIIGHCSCGLDFYSSICGKLKEFRLLLTLHESGEETDNDEPVGLMSFDNLDCLFMVKSTKDISSLEARIRNELLAYEREYGQENKTVILLVLGGGNHPFEAIHDNHPVLNAMVFYCPWQEMQSVIKDISRNGLCREYRDQLILDEVESSLKHLIVCDDTERGGIEGMDYEPVGKEDQV